MTAGPAAAQTPSPDQLALMDSIAESPLIEGRIAGLSVLMVRGRDTIFKASYGQADLEWDVPMTDDAVFEIGSVTKQFTAAAVLKLRDAGKLDLDADITRYLEDYPVQGHRIPVRRLLDHTSGIKGMTEMPVFASIRRQALPRDSVVTLIAAEPFDFPPGEALIYNNSAYFLLGLIIEEVSGATYEEFIEREIFEPLGMDRSSYCSNSEVIPRRAHGYQLTNRKLVRAGYVDHRWPYSAGSLCSTTEDMMTWLQALHGGAVLPDSSYQEMITPGRLNDGTPVRYAMGVSVAPDPRGRAVIQHGGGIPGFVSDARYYPEHDLYSVMLINTTGNLSPTALTLEMIDEFVPGVPVETAPFTGDPDALVGTYSGPARGRPLTIQIVATEGGISGGPPRGRKIPLRWVEGLTFRLGTVQLVTFERNAESGPATVMRLDGGGSHYVLRREPG